MRIKKIKVIGLYGYLDKEIDFYSDENYLIGINGCGKSSILNILEAFFLKNDEYFKKLNYVGIKIVTTNNEYKLFKNITMDDDEIYELCINSEKKNIKERERELEKLSQELLKNSNESKEEILNKIKNLKEVDYYWNKLSSVVEEDEKIIALNMKTPTLDNSIFENFLKKDSINNLDNMEKILLEINPARNLKNILNEVGKKNLQYCRAKDELEKIKSMLDEETEGLIFDIERKVRNNKITLEKVQEFLETINNFLCDSHKKMEYDKLEGNFSLWILSKKFEKIKELTDYSFLSSGERNLLSLITKVYFILEENSVLLIDEPEESLHIAWQQKIIPAIKIATNNKNIQIIIATHAPNVTGEMINPEKLIPIYPYSLEEK